jgi:hypothetical protein
MNNLTPLKNTMLGALIGTVRATGGGEVTTEKTFPLILKAVSALTEDGISDDEIQKLTDSLTTEKHTLAPDCSVCPNPCGRTADYDINTETDIEIRSLKTDIAKCLAEYVRQTENPDCIFVVGTLFNIGESLTKDELTAIYDEILSKITK